MAVKHHLFQVVRSVGYKDEPLMRVGKKLSTVVMLVLLLNDYRYVVYKALKLLCEAYTALMLPPLVVCKVVLRPMCLLFAVYEPPTVLSLRQDLCEIRPLVAPHAFPDVPHFLLLFEIDFPYV